MAIADELNELKQTKASIKEKLINKDLEPTDVFSTYPTLIDELSNQQTMTQAEYDGEENRMSVVNSLITNNIDRTKFEASGTATITLSATTKALLTAEEISQIEAMGYTLA